MLLSPVVVPAAEEDGAARGTEEDRQTISAAALQAQTHTNPRGCDLTVAPSSAEGRPFESVSKGVVLASVNTSSSACDLCLDYCNDQWWQCRQSCGTSFKCSWQICEPQLRACGNACYSSGTCP
jgi:hypothetical protein